MKNQWNNRVVGDHLGSLNTGSSYAVMNIHTFNMVQTLAHVTTYMDYGLQICETSNSSTINGSSN